MWLFIHEPWGFFFFFTTLVTQAHSGDLRSLAFSLSSAVFNLFIPHISSFFPAITQADCEDKCTRDTSALSSLGSKKCCPSEECFAVQSRSQCTSETDAVAVGKLLKLPWASVSSFEYDSIIQNHGWSLCKWAQIDQALSIVTGTWALGEKVTLLPAPSPPCVSPTRGEPRVGALIYFSDTGPSLKIHL